MHELWLCRTILEIVMQKVQAQPCQRVKKITLEVGCLRAVDSESLNFSFQVLTQGTVAQGAELQLIDVPGEARCDACQHKVPVAQYSDACHFCGHQALTVTQGEELRVKSMVVE